MATDGLSDMEVETRYGSDSDDDGGDGVDSQDWVDDGDDDGGESMHDAADGEETEDGPQAPHFEVIRDDRYGAVCADPTLIALKPEERSLVEAFMEAYFTECRSPTLRRSDLRYVCDRAMQLLQFGQDHDKDVIALLGDIQAGKTLLMVLCAAVAIVKKLAGLIVLVSGGNNTLWRQGAERFSPDGPLHVLRHHAHFFFDTSRDLCKSVVLARYEQMRAAHRDGLPIVFIVKKSLGPLQHLTTLLGVTVQTDADLLAAAAAAAAAEDDEVEVQGPPDEEYNWRRKCPRRRTEVDEDEPALPACSTAASYEAVRTYLTRLCGARRLLLMDDECDDRTINIAPAGVQSTRLHAFLRDLFVHFRKGDGATSLLFSATPGANFMSHSQDPLHPRLVARLLSGPCYMGIVRLVGDPKRRASAFLVLNDKDYPTKPLGDSARSVEKAIEGGRVVGAAPPTGLRGRQSEYIAALSRGEAPSPFTVPMHEWIIAGAVKQWRADVMYWYRVPSGFTAATFVAQFAAVLLGPGFDNLLAALQPSAADLMALYGAIEGRRGEILGFYSDASPREMSMSSIGMEFDDIMVALARGAMPPARAPFPWHMRELQLPSARKAACFADLFAIRGDVQESMIWLQVLATARGKTLRLFAPGACDEVLEEYMRIEPNGCSRMINLDNDDEPIVGESLLFAGIAGSWYRLPAHSTSSLIDYKRSPTASTLRHRHAMLVMCGVLIDDLDLLYTAVRRIWNLEVKMHYLRNEKALRTAPSAIVQTQFAATAHRVETLGDYPGFMPQWCWLARYLCPLAERVKGVLVASRSNLHPNVVSTKFDPTSPDHPDVAFIVGGGIVTRGVTIAGVTNTVHLRANEGQETYDTTLQSMRVLGYRCGDEDLVRFCCQQRQADTFEECLRFYMRLQEQVPATGARYLSRTLPLPVPTSDVVHASSRNKIRPSEPVATRGGVQYPRIARPVLKGQACHEVFSKTVEFWRRMEVTAKEVAEPSRDSKDYARMMRDAVEAINSTAGPKRMRIRANSDVVWHVPIGEVLEIVTSICRLNNTTESLRLLGEVEYAARFTEAQYANVALRLAVKDRPADKVPQNESNYDLKRLLTGLSEGDSPATWKQDEKNFVENNPLRKLSRLPDDPFMFTELNSGNRYSREERECPRALRDNYFDALKSVTAGDHDPKGITKDYFTYTANKETGKMEPQHRKASAPLLVVFHMLHPRFFARNEPSIPVAPDQQKPAKTKAGKDRQKMPRVKKGDALKGADCYYERTDPHAGEYPLVCLMACIPGAKEHDGSRVIKSLVPKQ